MSATQTGSSEHIGKGYNGEREDLCSGFDGSRAENAGASQ